jgi:hypothetical protein
MGSWDSLTLLVTTQIEGGEAVVADGELLGGGVCGGLENGDTVVLLNALVSNWLVPTCPTVQLDPCSMQLRDRCLTIP